MANDLTIPTGAQLPAYLRNVQPTRNEEFLSGTSSGPTLPILSFRGKGWRIRQGANEVSLRRNEIDVVLLRARVGLSKRYYDTGYTPGETLPPRCWSTDGITPDGTNPIAPACRGCPNNAWGSATTATRASKGKACTDYKRLVVWPLIDVGGNKLIQACILDLPPTSLRAPRGSVEQQYSEFTANVARNGIPLEAVRAHIEFADDAESPRLLWSFGGMLTEEEFLTAQEMAASADVEATVGGEDGAAGEPVARVEQASPAVQVREQEPEPEPAKAAPAPPKPRAARPAPAPAPAKAATPPSAQEAEDLLSEIKSRLGL